MCHVFHLPLQNLVPHVLIGALLSSVLFHHLIGRPPAPYRAPILPHLHRAVEERLEQARALVGERSLRIWRIYLAGCAYGFAHNWMNIHQILAVKPLPGGGHNLPLTRADLYI